MHISLWKKCLALALTLVTVALLMPAMHFSARADAPVEISAAELNLGTATDSIYQDGDTIRVTGDTPLDLVGFGVFSSFRDNGKSFHLILNEATTEIPAKAFTNIAGKRGLLSIKGDGVKVIRPDGLSGWDTLESIDFPNAKHAEYYAFSSNKALTAVNLPLLEGPPADRSKPPFEIEPLQQLFQNCISLESIELPALITVDQSMFENCKSLALVNLPSATEIASAAFDNCEALHTLKAPKLLKISCYAFADDLYSTDLVLTTLYYPDKQPEVIGYEPYYKVPDGLTIFVENPDPSYNDLSKFPAGTTVRKIGGDNGGGPATPEGIGGGLIGNFPATSVPKDDLAGNGIVSQEPLGTAIVTARRLNVRPTADTSLRPLGRLRKGVQIEVLGVENNFAQIKYQGTYAYVSLDFLKLNFDPVK